MIAELSGFGILAHVWTKPEDRKNRACTELMKVLMEDFKFRQGKALFLFTRFNSVAYHIYKKFGLRSIESKSGFMDWNFSPYITIIAIRSTKNIGVVITD